MNNILTNPYNLLESIKFRIAFIFGGLLFAFIFLYVFEPYGIYNLYGMSKLIAIALYSGAGTIALTIHFLLLQPLFLKKHTVLNSILWLALSFVLLTISCTIVNAWLFNNGEIEFFRFWAFLKIIFSINIIPTTLFIIIHYNYITTKRLKKALELNKHIKQKSSKPRQEQNIIIPSTTKNSDLAINISQLLYMEAADNYVKVFYINNGQTTHTLLRNTLSSICKELKTHPNIFRCHKSFIVNKDHIEQIEGNAAGYKIKLSGISDPIPVSRSLNQEIMKI